MYSRRLGLRREREEKKKGRKRNKNDELREESEYSIVSRDTAGLLARGEERCNKSREDPSGGGGEWTSEAR